MGGKYKVKMLVDTFLPTYGLLAKNAFVYVDLKTAWRWVEWGVAEESDTLPDQYDDRYALIVHEHEGKDITDLTGILTALDGDIMAAVAEDFIFEHDVDGDGETIVEYKALLSEDGKYGLLVNDDGFSVLDNEEVKTLADYIAELTADGGDGGE